jgi:hypothetical protein
MYTVISRSLLLCFLSVCCWAQGIPPYPNAVTDRLLHGKTPMTPPPVNTVFQDPDFGSAMVRVTDENTNPRIPGSFYRNATPDANQFSIDNRKFYVAGDNRSILAFAFDPSTMEVSPLPGAGQGGGVRIPLISPTFSFLNPDLMFGTISSYSLTLSTYSFTTGKTESVFDVTTCGTQPPLVRGPKTSSGDLTVSTDDNRIVISAGANQFGNRPFVIVYDKKLGCRWYNTQTGQVGGRWGAVGQVSTPDRFLINHSKISGSGRYVRIGVGRTGFYVWDVATLDVQSCYFHGGPKCSGYGATGHDAYINAPGGIDELNTFRRSLGDLSNLTQLINPLPEPHYKGMEKHFAWNTGRLDDNSPVCGSTYSPSGGNEVTQPYDGEIFCIETDGIGSTVWRFAHNRAIWENEYYWTEPVGNLSLDGRFYIFTSSWDDQVGLTQAGEPRTDLWILKLE